LETSLFHQTTCNAIVHMQIIIYDSEALITRRRGFGANMVSGFLFLKREKKYRKESLIGRFISSFPKYVFRDVREVSLTCNACSPPC
jgi:hypothetical protein